VASLLQLCCCQEPDTTSTADTSPSSIKVREESKRKQEAIGKNHAVKLQTQQVTQSRKQKFAETTLLKRQDKKVVLTIIKKERRSLSGN
jgi:hypothetical protein